MKFAVLDLGTNTFHLLIAGRDAAGEWRILKKNKVFVKLAEEGIHRIGDDAFRRGLDAIQTFKTELDAVDVPVSNIKAIGTAALRTAENAPEFLNRVAQIACVRPEIISGEREAELICKGVRQAVPFPDNRVLIMDIGGGSVEFIVADRERVFWQHSFPVGAAVLWRKFQHNDPITQAEIQSVENHLDVALANLWEALAKHPCPTLVGASGTFDVIDLFLLDPTTKPELYGYLPVTAFYPLYERLIASSVAKRRAMPALPEERVEMVVVALILIRFVLEKAGIGEIYTSAYAMKEGMLAELAKS